MTNQPFKASKIEEPEESTILIQPLDTLVNNTKTEGFDTLFSKQNQLATGPTLGQGLGLGSTSNSLGGTSTGGHGSFSFEGLGTPTGVTNSSPTFDFGMLGGGTPTTAPSKYPLIQDTSTSNASGMTIPKPAEKTLPMTSNTMGGLTMGSLDIGSNSGGITMGSNGLGGGMSSMMNTQNSASGLKFTTPVVQKPQQSIGGMTNGMMDFSTGNSTGIGAGLGLGSAPPKNQSKANYNAFDEITLNDEALGGMTFGGGMNQGGLGLSLNGGIGTGASGGFGTVANGGFGSSSTMGGLSLGNQQNTDTFGRGMGGLMMNPGNIGGGASKANDNPFDGLLSGNTLLGGLSSGMNNTPGAGNGSQNVFGDFGGGMSLTNGNSGFGGGGLGMSGLSSGMIGGMGTFNNLGSGGFGMSNGMGTLGGQPTQQPKMGILSNPTLTVKSNQQPQNAKLNNFNEFDLL